MRQLLPQYQPNDGSTLRSGRRDRKSRQRHTDWDRMGQGLPATMLWCCAHDKHPHYSVPPNPCPRNNAAWGVKSGSLWPQNQHTRPTAPPNLGNILQGLGNLGIRARRASHDGSASAPTESQLLTQSTHGDRRVDRHAPLQANTGAPTTHRIGCDRRVAPVLQGRDHSIDHAATVTGYRARTCRLHSHDAV